MIIQILGELKEEGYLAKGRHPTVAPFFAGANVAMRRRALEEIGGYDPAVRHRRRLRYLRPPVRG